MPLRTGPLGVAFAVSATAAAAVPVTYDLSGAAGEAGSLEFSGDGPDLTVTARSFDAAGAVREGGDSLVTRSEDGLGARNSSTSDWADNPFVDGRTPRDVRDLLVFTFDRAVTSVTLGFVGQSGFEVSDFALFLPTDTGLAPAADGEAFAINDAETFGFVADAFAIGAPEADDRFRVSSITFETAVAPVPLPAAGGLLLGALGLLALRRQG